MRFWVLVILLFAVPVTAQTVPSPGPGTANGHGAGGTISVRGSVTYDSGTVTTTPALALPVAANAGDLIFVGIPNGSNSSIATNGLCDKVGSGTCTTPASTWTTTGLAQCQGSDPCTVAGWTCNASAGVDHLTVTLTGVTDENVIIAVVAHTVTSSCLDQHPTPVNSGSAGSTITSNAFTTTAANEIAFYFLSDDNNCGPSWTGSHGTGYTLIPVATSCSSMLGAAEYKIFTSIQTGVTASLNTGNSSGNPVATDALTFK